MRLPSSSASLLNLASSALAGLYFVIAAFATITAIAFIAWVLGYNSVRWDALATGWLAIGTSVAAIVIIDRIGRIKIKRRNRY
jgi:uncharacterized membrane protein YqjE